MLVSISLDTAPEPNFAIPASLLTGAEALTSVVPSTRQIVLSQRKMMGAKQMR